MKNEPNALTSNIVKISEATFPGQTLPTVSARDLHTSLGVSKDFSDWVKAQIKRADLTEDVDFVVLPQKGENLTGGRPALEYHLTIDAGKNIAMLSGTAKGKGVRTYFIACERELKTAHAPTLNNPVMNMIVQQAIQYDRLEQEQAKLASQLQVATSLISNTTARVEQIAAIVGAQDPQYYTVKAYSNIIRHPVTLKLAQELGRAAVKLSKAQGVEVGQVRDSEFGHVKAYHESILEQVFAQMEEAHGEY